MASEAFLAKLECDMALLRETCAEAGRIALGFFGQDQDNDVWYKSGRSPVSEADMAVNMHLQEKLLDARPDYGWLSEETTDDADAVQKRKNAEYAFVVDPIDGTRGFINHRREWCISVAVVKDGAPVAGILECPALGEVFTAVRGGGAFINGSGIVGRQNDKPVSKPLVTGSRKLIDELRSIADEYYEIMDFVPSLAYRLAMVANGKLDVAFARPGASAWDIAAAHLILEESGCVLCDVDRAKPEYSAANFSSGSLVACPNLTLDPVLSVANELKFLQKRYTYSKPA